MQNEVHDQNIKFEERVKALMDNYQIRIDSLENENFLSLEMLESLLAFNDKILEKLNDTHIKIDNSVNALKKDNTGFQISPLKWIVDSQASLVEFLINEKKLSDELIRQKFDKIKDLLLKNFSMNDLSPVRRKKAINELLLIERNEKNMNTNLTPKLKQDIDCINTGKKGSSNLKENNDRASKLSFGIQEDTKVINKNTLTREFTFKKDNFKNSFSQLDLNPLKVKRNNDSAAQNSGLSDDSPLPIYRRGKGR